LATAGWTFTTHVPAGRQPDTYTASRRTQTSSFWMDFSGRLLRNHWRKAAFILGVWGSLSVGTTQAGVAGSTAGTALRYDTEYPLIGYADKPTHNAIARLQDRMGRGELKLKFVPGRGYLDSLLKALAIDPSSQTLVYSKTSLQIDLIKAATPRAIYFDDTTYVAWIPETNMIEITTMDSAVGPVFYTLSNRDPTSALLGRETSRCLTCHDTFSMMGGGVPRFLFMSSPVTVAGEPLTTEISKETTDATPLRERWGGWYVTGAPNNVPHLGNLQIKGPAQPVQTLDSLKVAGHTVDKLDGLIDTKPYLTNHSDIVALLVFEHQVYIENLITRANYKARTMVARANDGQPADALTWDQLPPKARPMVRAMLEPLVKALLFVDATTLPTRIAGNSGFDRWFQSQGPRDAQGRSLRELDLTTHVFRYHLSYMIYSIGFDGLPTYAHDYVYQRIADILSGRDQSPAYSHISPADRATALQILAQTKPAFAAFTQAHSMQTASAQSAQSSSPTT
jgi:hypothetical protein